MASHRPTGFLLDHHRDLETACWILRARAAGGDQRALISAYRSFEQPLTAQLDAEEELLFPDYAVGAPAIGSRLFEAHDALRRQLIQVGIGVELGALRIDQVDSLLDALRSHAWYEDVTVYRWADAHADRTQLERLATQLFGAPRNEPTHPVVFASR